MLPDEIKQKSENAALGQKMLFPDGHPLAASHWRKYTDPFASFQRRG